MQDQSIVQSLDFTNLRVLITGAAGGLGQSLAQEFARAGAELILADIDGAGLARVAEGFAARDNAQMVTTQVYDQADLGSVAGLAAAAGRVDVLINNAAMLLVAPLLDTDPAAIGRVIDTNLVGPMVLARHVAVPMVAHGRGVIINIVDIHAIRPLADYGLYGAAKAGLAFLTRALARDLAPDVRVNGVAPGAILWPEGGVSDQMRDSVLRQIPLKRLGDPTDIATCVLYLVRDAPYVTGQIIAVDGGRSVGW